MELAGGHDIIRLELPQVPDGTELTLLDTLGEQGKPVRDGAGWNACLDALAAGLQSREDARSAIAVWPVLNAKYIERFGPEAATIGPAEEFGRTYD